MTPLSCTLRPLTAQEFNTVRHLLAQDEPQLFLNHEALGIGAFSQGVALGVMVLINVDDLLFVRRIFVSAGYRRRGVATRLLEAARAMAQRRGLKLTIPFLAADLNEPVYRLLASTHAFVMTRSGGVQAVVTIDPDKPVLKSLSPQLYFDQPKMVRADFVSELERIQPMLARDLQVSAASYRRDLSCCQFQGGTIRAACLIKEEQDRLQMYILAGLPGESRRTAAAVLSTMELLRQQNRTQVWIQTVDREQTMLLDWLKLPYHIVHRYYLAYAKLSAQEGGASHVHP